MFPRYVLTYPPGASRLHLVHINCVIRSSTECVKLDVSCHTWYLDLPGSEKRMITPYPNVQRVSEQTPHENKWSGESSGEVSVVAGLVLDQSDQCGGGTRFFHYFLRQRDGYRSE